MTLRTVCWNGCLLLVLSGCGSATVDAGTLGNGGSRASDAGGTAGTAAGGAGGTGASAVSDAGATPGNGAWSCTIPELHRYRLVFDSDGRKLERRIYSMRADGSEVEALTPPEELAREPAMSPDGSKLAYVTPEGIKLLDMASRQSELLVGYGDQPTWSADGSMLAYRQFYGVLELRNMSAGGTTRDGGTASAGDTTTFPSGYGVSNPELLPDGASVLSDGVRIMNLSDGSSNGAVTGGIHPTLSPDGVWVAAAMLCPGSDRLSLWTGPYAIPTPACEGRRLTPPSAPNATNPKWGPGVLIAYERGEPPRDIAIIAADTGEECVIEGPGDDRNPSWVVDTFTPPE